jgi:hypothetical protein
MFQSSVLNGDFHFNGALSCKTLVAPPLSIGDAEIKAVAAINATKVVHQFPVYVSQAPGSAVIAATSHLHILRAVGEIVSIEAMTPTPATGADRTVSIDLQKSTGGGAFATVLNAPITLNNATTARTPVSGAINSTALIDNDILQLVVTVAGAVGNQAQGLLVAVTLRENPL